ncbi:MAG: RNA polymerase sigma factor [Gammaproteobacteria bacterium]
MTSESPGGAACQQQDIVDLETRSWLPRHCRGDGSAFPKLMQAYRAPVYSYLTRCGLDRDVRDDLFQDIFLKIHKAAASYQPAKPLRPWIFTIAANTVRNYLRSESGRPTASLDQGTSEHRDPAADTETHTELHGLLDWLEQAIAGLPFKQREVLLLTAVEGLRQNEAAEALQIPLNTVKTHLRRARLTLVQALARRNGEDDAGVTP